MTKTQAAHSTIAQAEHVLKDVYLPRITRCVEVLSTQQIWWRPNKASNSVGNLVLHLEGNVRQWIISGLGGASDTRNRDQEFSEAGPRPRRELIARLQKTVGEACRIVRKLNIESLERTYSIQKFQVTGYEAVFHVAEHFSHHAGQIILLTKMLTGSDLKFTNLPGGKGKKAGKLPVW
jgi:uncharacterized damage-inducible protein DinB